MQCGACWAISAADALSAYAAKANSSTPIQLSAQQLIDCDLGDNGCQGGQYTEAWYYTADQGNMCIDDKYVYVVALCACLFFRVKAAQVACRPFGGVMHCVSQPACR